MSLIDDTIQGGVFLMNAKHILIKTVTNYYANLLIFIMAIIE